MSSKLYILIRYDYVWKDEKTIMGFFETREDVNEWKKCPEFKSEYKMKTLEFSIDEYDLKNMKKKGLLGITEGFRHLRDVL